MQKTVYSSKIDIPISLVDKDFGEKYENDWEIQLSEIASFSDASGNQYYLIINEESEIKTRGTSNYSFNMLEVLAPVTTLSEMNSNIWISEFPQCTQIIPLVEHQERKKDKLEYYSFMENINFEIEEREPKDTSYDIKQIYDV